MSVETLDSETSNGTGPTDVIRNALQPLIEFRDELETKRRAVRAELTDLDEEIKQIERHLKLAGIIPKQSFGPQTKVKRGWGVSPGMLARAEEVLPDEEFTIKALSSAMGTADETAKKAIDALYSQGKVRKTGLKVPAGNTSPQKALHFKRVDS